MQKVMADGERVEDEPKERKSDRRQKIRDSTEVEREKDAKMGRGRQGREESEKELGRDEEEEREKTEAGKDEGVAVASRSMSSRGSAATPSPRFAPTTLRNSSAPWKVMALARALSFARMASCDKRSRRQ